MLDCLTALHSCVSSNPSNGLGVAVGVCDCDRALEGYSSPIGYIVGILLAFLVSLLARLARFDRDRAFYPTLLIVIASYYVLFAVMGGSMGALVVESLIMTVFLAVAFVGFKGSLWLVVAALAGHGLFDLVHAEFVANPGVPPWWPSFCLAFDGVAASFLAWVLTREACALDDLELRIPPLVLVVTVALLIWLTARASPVFQFIFPWHSVAATALAVLGVAIGLSGIVSFRRARTTVNPITPSAASALVISGVYRFTRNPMYLGLLLAIVGWAVFCSNALAWIWVPAFVAYMNRFQIRPEERALATLFNDDFRVYQSRVRRWI